MRSQEVVFTVLLVYSAFGHAAKPPTWLKTCYRDDPDYKFKDCALKNGQLAIPSLAQGDRKFRIPAMDPLEVTEIHIDKGVYKIGLDIVVRDIKIMGLAQTKLIEYNIDFEKQRMYLAAYIPVTTVLSTYNVTGRILLLPIVGQGPSNITLIDTTFNVNSNYELETRNNKTYMLLNTPHTEFKNSKLFITLENLFNGNKLLGDSMNKVLQDNWQDLIVDLGPPMIEAITDAIFSTVTHLLEIIPFDDIFPPKPK